MANTTTNYLITSSSTNDETENDSIIKIIDDYEKLEPSYQYQLLEYEDDIVKLSEVIQEIFKEYQDAPDLFNLDVFNHRVLSYIAIFLEKFKETIDHSRNFLKTIATLVDLNKKLNHNLDEQKIKSENLKNEIKEVKENLVYKNLLIQKLEDENNAVRKESNEFMNYLQTIEAEKNKETYTIKEMKNNVNHQIEELLKEIKDKNDLNIILEEKIENLNNHLKNLENLNKKQNQETNDIRKVQEEQLEELKRLKYQIIEKDQHIESLKADNHMLLFTHKDHNSNKKSVNFIIEPKSEFVTENSDNENEDQVHDLDNQLLKKLQTDTPKRRNDSVRKFREMKKISILSSTGDETRFMSKERVSMSSRKNYDDLFQNQQGDNLAYTLENLQNEYSSTDMNELNCFISLEITKNSFEINSLLKNTLSKIRLEICENERIKIISNKNRSVEFKNMKEQRIFDFSIISISTKRNSIKKAFELDNEDKLRLYFFMTFKELDIDNSIHNEEKEKLFYEILKKNVSCINFIDYIQQYLGYDCENSETNSDNGNDFPCARLF